MYSIHWRNKRLFPQVFDNSSNNIQRENQNSKLNQDKNKRNNFRGTNKLAHFIIGYAFVFTIGFICGKWYF